MFRIYHIKVATVWLQEIDLFPSCLGFNGIFYLSDFFYLQQDTFV